MAKHIFTRAVRPTDTLGRDDWETPQSLFRNIANLLGGFDRDVCATKATAKCKYFYSPEQDGLKQPWAPFKCWCNPPYSSWSDWVIKAEVEAKDGAAVCMLIPPKTETKCWHEHAMQSASAIVMLKSRVSFLCDGKPVSGNTYGSELVIWDHYGQWALPFLVAPKHYTWDWKYEEDEF